MSRLDELERLLAPNPACPRGHAMLFWVPETVNVPADVDKPVAYRDVYTTPHCRMCDELAAAEEAALDEALKHWDEDRTTKEQFLAWANKGPVGALLRATEKARYLGMAEAFAGCEGILRDMASWTSLGTDALYAAIAADISKWAAEARAKAEK